MLLFTVVLPELPLLRPPPLAALLPEIVLLLIFTVLKNVKIPPPAVPALLPESVLFVTVSTVEQHLTRVYRKLCVSGRADLLAFSAEVRRSG